MQASRLLSSLISASALITGLVWAQTAAPLAAQPKPAMAAVVSPSAQTTQPLWKELSNTQQSALKPLAANWDTMGLGQKRKWLSVAKDYDKLPPAQQVKLHTRMTEWVSLSPQQRANARQNFAQHKELTDGLTPEQRKAQWQAYQALSPEQKRKLAEGAPKPQVAGAATATKPQPVLRKDPPPEFGTGKVLAKARLAPQSPGAGKKIAVAPHVATQGILLPGSLPTHADKP
jgi:Protein of unknown function (DUF3106)